MHDQAMLHHISLLCVFLFVCFLPGYIPLFFPNGKLLRVPSSLRLSVFLFWGVSSGGHFLSSDQGLSYIICTEQSWLAIP